MAEKVLYEKRGEVAYITLNRPEVKNAIDIESHELLCDMWRDFRDDPGLRVAVITGTGDAFTAGADLKTHAPEWQTVGPMVAANVSRTVFAGSPEDRCRASPSPSSPRSTAGASARRRAGDGMRHPDRL
jgi:enoyl-CoA hydratase/carnithine racemase